MNQTATAPKTSKKNARGGTVTERQKLITVEEASSILGVSKAKIRKLIKEGRLRRHPYVLDRRYALVEEAQVEELRSHRIG